MLLRVCHIECRYTMVRVGHTTWWVWYAIQGVGYTTVSEYGMLLRLCHTECNVFYFESRVPSWFKRTCLKSISSKGV